MASQKPAGPRMLSYSINPFRHEDIPLVCQVKVALALIALAIHNVFNRHDLQHHSTRFSASRFTFPRLRTIMPLRISSAAG